MSKFQVYKLQRSGTNWLIFELKNNTSLVYKSTASKQKVQNMKSEFKEWGYEKNKVDISNFKSQREFNEEICDYYVKYKTKLLIDEHANFIKKNINVFNFEEKNL